MNNYLGLKLSTETCDAESLSTLTVYFWETQWMQAVREQYRSFFIQKSIKIFTIMLFATHGEKLCQENDYALKVLFWICLGWGLSKPRGCFVFLLKLALFVAWTMLLRTTKSTEWLGRNAISRGYPQSFLFETISRENSWSRNLLENVRKLFLVRFISNSKNFVC